MTPHTLVHELLHQSIVDAEVIARGWVKTRRDAKTFSFVEINDGSCLANLQVICDADLPGWADLVHDLQPGAAVEFSGMLRASQGGGQRVELHASAVRLFGACPAEGYPLQKKRISFERLREVAHLRARTNTFGAIARVRNLLAKATHDFFQARKFLYLHSPIVTASDCEGAGEMFRVTTLDLEHLPRTESGAVDHSQDFFGRPANLTVSGQLSAETYACALGRVYTFGPTFRAENSNTTRHLSEFWMIEPEMAFADLGDDARLAEDYLKVLLGRVLDEADDDLALFNKWVDKGLRERLESVVAAEFAHLTYTEAITVLEKAGRDFEFPVGWGIDLQSEHERYLSEEYCRRPVVVTDFPRDLKAFYMRQNDDGKTVAALDVLCPQVGEIIGGSQREERLDVLEARLAELGLPREDYWWYLDLRRFGTVPHAGFGLGFERLVQFATGMANIRDVIPYPRTPRHAEF